MVKLQQSGMARVMMMVESGRERGRVAKTYIVGLPAGIASI
jgi:hypothetical protein